MEFIIFVILVCLGYFVGTTAESRHYRSIEEREKNFLRQPALSMKTGYDDSAVQNAWLVTGNAVVSIDYFKRILAALRSIVGGQVSSYETLVDRARREAVLRMRKQAEGADMIINVRIETSSIGKSANRKQSVGSIEALAYGTAIWLKK